VTAAPRDRCGGPKGKVIYLTRLEARAALVSFRAKYGRGKAKRCVWGDHYHLTKGLMGQKGRRSR
jgi:hypothetical protein